jgi:hydroxypyruvate reductase
MSTVLDERSLLRALFDAAVASAQPARVLAGHLPAPPRGRTIVVGAGKASAAMAQALEAHWKGDLEGVVVTRYGYGAPCRRIAIVEAAHPVPDAAGVAAAQRVLAAVAGLTPDDLVVALISGGGSALVTAPYVPLEDLQALTSLLLASGARIAEINILRRQLDRLKGGGLARATKARVLSLILSDVIGNPLEAIASGPTAPDPTTKEDALAVLKKYKLEKQVSESILHILLRAPSAALGSTVY